MKRHKVFLKVILCVILAPIVVIASLGIIQGLAQVSYHIDPKKAIESYRNEPPLCFLYFSAPSGLEDIAEILDEYALDDNTAVFTVKSAVDGLENETAVSFCKTREFFGRKWYAACNAGLILGEDDNVIYYNDKVYEFDKIKKSDLNENAKDSIHCFLSGDSDEVIVMKNITSD